jgi:hypothetical protein
VTGSTRRHPGNVEDRCLLGWNLAIGKTTTFLERSSTKNQKETHAERLWWQSHRPPTPRHPPCSPSPNAAFTGVRLHYLARHTSEQQVRLRNWAFCRGSARSRFHSQADSDSGTWIEVRASNQVETSINLHFLERCSCDLLHAESNQELLTRPTCCALAFKLFFSPICCYTYPS